jgi:polar amino acid transport system substrate-binding protein
MLNTYINKLRLPVQSSYEIPYADRLGFAFAKGSPIRDDFNKYLKELGPEKINSYISKWEK